MLCFIKPDERDFAPFFWLFLYWKNKGVNMSKDIFNEENMYNGEHTIEELRQMQSLPLLSKISMTKNRIKAWYEYYHGNVYISFSGGKDSTVLLHLVQEMYKDVPIVYVDTGLEYPEVREFALSIPNIITLQPVRYDTEDHLWERTTFKEVIQKEGYPVVSKEVSNTVWAARRGLESIKRGGKSINETAIKKLKGTLKDKNGNKSKHNCSRWWYLIHAPFKISDKCCDIMKKNPINLYEKETGRVPMLGILTTESSLRLSSWLKNGCNNFSLTRPISMPLAFWTEEDILEYLYTYKCKYASIYGDIIYENGHYYNTGVHRTGCMFCMFGLQQEDEPNRFQQMKITHPKIYDYCIKPLDEGGLGLGAIMDYMGIDYV